ncbi:MAG TPA: O-antigen polymerase, partial [Longimicrobiales bacterium]|nr:O-antigen polymerase [Longimicrobiales bacterium]
LAVYYSGAVVTFPIRGSTLGLFLMGLAAFLAGALLPRLLSRDAVAVRTLGILPDRAALGLQTGVLVLLAISVVGSLLYMRLLHQAIGIQSLWQNPAMVRLAEGTELRYVGWVGVTRGFMVPAFVLACLSYRHMPVERRRTMKIAALVAFLLCIPSAGRTLLMTLAVWGSLVIIYSMECDGLRRPVRRLATPLAIIALVMMGYFLLVGQVLQKALANHYAIVEMTRLPPALSGIADVIHYQTYGLPAFERLVDMPREFEQRASLTFGVASRLMYSFDAGRFDRPEYVQPFVFVPLSTNLYTWFDAFYMDFGWWGMILLPLATGLLSGAAYAWMRAAPGVLKIYITGLVGVCVLQSTTVNRFGNFQTWVWLIGPPLIVVLCRVLAERLPARTGFGAPAGPAHVADPA